MKIIKKLITSSGLIFLPTLALANAERELLLVQLFDFTLVIAFILGIVVALQTLYRVKRQAEAPQDQSATTSRIIMLGITAALLLNTNAAINIATATITGTEAYCFTLNPASSGKLSNAQDCFDPSSAEISSDLVKQFESTGAEDLTRYISLAMGAVQFLGLIFFIRSLLMLKQVGEGQGQVSPGKAIIAMIASTLVIDLPHTINIILDTLKALNITI